MCRRGDRRGRLGLRLGLGRLFLRGGSAARGGDEAVKLAAAAAAAAAATGAATPGSLEVASPAAPLIQSRPNEELSPCCPSSLLAAASAFNPASTVDSMSFAILDACSAA